MVTAQKVGDVFLGLFAICFGTFISCFIPWDVAEKSGPNSAMVPAFFFSVVWTVVGIFCMRSMQKKDEGWIGFGIAIATPLATWFIFAPAAEKKWQDQLAMAEVVAEFGLKHFQVLDKDGNNEISDRELKERLEQPNLDETERKYVSHMRGHANILGHVNGTEWAGDSAVNTYGINREDLVTYKDRTEKSRKTRW